MKRTAMICVAAMVLTGCNANRSGYDAEGYFESTEVTVSAESSGKILYFNAEEGADVEAGTLLGCIDTVQLYLTRMQLAKSAESVLKNRPDIAKQVQAMKEQLKTLEREKDRVARLLADGAATQKQMDDIESQIAVMEVQLDAQETALENSVSSLDAQSSSIGMQIAQIDDKLAKCRISSPVSGTVLTKYAEAGEFVAAGRPLFKVADLDRVYLRAYVTSAQLSEIKIGQQVKVYSDYGKGYSKEYPGTVTWISSQSEFTPKNIQTDDERRNLVYAIKVAVGNDGLIKLGMYGGIVF
ncbi:MAG: HlyD family efflux transporter periplasmic adaptor subunit [Bacteroidetes bacterium]|uniref:HlyD family efflux transporter periplasmic adaptor subunit n=1 Tax=Candidatus Cryptobacteroides merdavium TaxID=2840769 RepID=A0A9D9HDL0_9BACT|nr:HlyD family efflux transporter periplasmic adaptor subunit [Candidatus Cryptobacteroides merdavium]